MHTLRVPKSKRESIRRAVISSTRLFALGSCVQVDNTALHHAAESGHCDVVEFLLKRGASVNLQNRVGVGFGGNNSSIARYLLMP